MSLDYMTVYTAGKYSILGAITSGIFGYLIGRVFDKRKPRLKNDGKKHNRV